MTLSDYKKLRPEEKLKFLNNVKTGRAKLTSKLNDRDLPEILKTIFK